MKISHVYSGLYRGIRKRDLISSKLFYWKMYSHNLQEILITDDSKLIKTSTLRNNLTFIIDRIKRVKVEQNVHFEQNIRVYGEVQRAGLHRWIRLEWIACIDRLKHSLLNSNTRYGTYWKRHFKTATYLLFLYVVSKYRR